MKKDIYYRKTPSEPYTDVSLPRHPDIRSFHFSLDRIFGDQYEYVGETHPFYELVYVISGSIGVTAGEKIYVLDTGQCLLHEPNEFHRLWSERRSEPHVLNLSFHATSMPENDRGRIWEPDSDLQDEFLQISLDVRDGLHNADADLLNEQRIRLESWFLRAVRCGKQIGATQNSGALRYSEIVRLLEEHLNEDLSAGDIAQISRMSLSSLKKIFARYAGMGVSRYFNEMKMRRAAELLREGKRVGEVASLLGFADQNYFSTVFRRIMGIPPGRYRDL